MPKKIKTEKQKEKAREYALKYYHKHKEERKKYRKNYREKHKKEIKDYLKEWRIQNKEKIKQSNKERRIQQKLLVINHYSNGVMKCSCCGEDDINVLTIDHINNDGAQHRREIGFKSGGDFYNWLINNGLPTGFQVLCMNCNCAKEWAGTCNYRKDKLIKTVIADRENHT